MRYDIKSTNYPNVGHNAWVKAYDTEELYDWFIEKELSN